MNQADSRRILWANGIIAAFYLRDDQIPAYKHLRSHRFPVYEAARRFGKTTIELCVDIENSINNNQHITRWCEPWKYQAREIVMPEMDKIQESCPSFLKAKFYKTDSFYEWPKTGSRLYLRGVNEDRGESSRGSFAHKIVADEKGSWKDPEYIVNEVLLPQLLTTKGALGSLSTPPRNLAHRWYADKELAVRDGRFLQNIIHDNKSLTREDIELFCEAMGGPQSPAWRREALCEAVPDGELQVVPEYREDLNDVPDDHPRPAYFDCYVGGDSGADDNTALLFGYYDFLHDTIVIEDELILSGKTSEVITDQAKRKEKENWGDKKKPLRRVYDADKQILIDITSTHGYSVYLPEKTDRIAAIRTFRIRVKQGKFKVKKKCKVLRYQMRVGMWRDEKHLDFERSEDENLKHLDAIAAAVYFNRSVITSRNPYPQHEGVSLASHYVPEHVLKERSEDEALADLFSSPLGGMIGGRS